MFMDHLQQSMLCYNHYSILHINGQDVCQCGWHGEKIKIVGHPNLCEGCGHDLPKKHIVREGLHICDICAEYDDAESEVSKPLTFGEFASNQARK